MILINCPNCGKQIFIDLIEKDELGWHTSCPECTGSFDVDFDEDGEALPLRTVLEYNRFYKNGGRVNE